MSAVLRPARGADGPFLAQMLVAAAFWRPEGPRGTVRDVMYRPDLAHYVAGWQRTGDLGVVAEIAERPVGAAWLRFLPESDPGYGFVDETTPELSIGVAHEWRGRGIGADLLDAVVVAARRAQVAAISLSVESDNDAGRLYERIGFREVGAVGGSRTMRLLL